MNHSTSVWINGHRGLWLVLLLYALATLPALTRYPAPWVDEGWIGEVAAQIASGHPPGNPSHGTLHRYNDRLYWMPPLYFYLLGGWFSMTDVALLAGRLFNVLLGGITVALLHDFIRRRLGSVPALIASLAFLLDTFVWKAHRTIRFESLMALLAILLARLVSDVLDREERGERPPFRLWAAVGAVAALLVNTHPMGSLFGLAALAEILRRGRFRIFATRGPWIAALAGLLLLVPWTVYCLLDASADFRNFLGQNSYHMDLAPHEGPDWMREWKRYAAWFPWPARFPAALAALLIVAGAIVAARREKSGKALPGIGLTFLVVPALGMALLPNKTLLYLVPVAPFLAVLAGVAWSRKVPWLRAAVLLFIGWGLLVDLGLLWRNRSCDPAAALTAIRSRLEPGDRVAGTFVTWWAAEPGPYLEFRRNSTLETVLTFGPDVILLGDRDWEQEKLGRLAPLKGDLERLFEEQNIEGQLIADPCLGDVMLYRLPKSYRSP